MSKYYHFCCFSCAMSSLNVVLNCQVFLQLFTFLPLRVKVSKILVKDAKIAKILKSLFDLNKLLLVKTKMCKFPGGYACCVSYCRFSRLFFVTTFVIVATLRENSCSNHYKHSQRTGNGSGIILFNSPGGSTFVIKQLFFYIIICINR